MLPLTASLPPFAVVALTFDPTHSGFSAERFHRISRFDTDFEPDAWTMLFWHIEADRWKACWMAQAAPHHFLFTVGAKFSVYRAPSRLMARGQIIEAPNVESKNGVGGR